MTKWDGVLVCMFVLCSGTNWALRIPVDNEELVDIELQEIHDISTGTRERRSTIDLPDRLDIIIPLTHSTVEISTRRNDDVDVNMPVYVMRDGDVVRETLPHIPNAALYQDISTGSSFLFSRSEPADSRRTNGSLFGIFPHEGDHYAIQTTEDDDADDAISHTVSKLPQHSFQLQNPIIADDLHLKQHLDGRYSRRKRQVPGDYVIELFCVTDYAIYKFWYDRTSGSNRNAKAKQLLRQYYAYLVNGIGARYGGITGQSYRMYVFSAGLYIADTANAAPWTEDHKIASGTKDIVVSNTVLDLFETWDQETAGLPNRDHSMLFTGYDVSSVVNGQVSRASTGIAYTRALCSTQSQSFVEDDFGFLVFATAAHELGHSCGAGHDGDDNGCSRAANYIMTAVHGINSDPEISQHLWHFSLCSVDEFDNYFRQLDSVDNNCMLATDAASSIPTTPAPMAEIYTPDVMCEYVQGQGSYVCRSIQLYSNLCSGVYCNSPGTTTCYLELPAEHTPCGSGKWCQQGVCVTSPDAADVSDNCPLGDRPGLIEDYDQTCTELIRDQPSLCYGSYYASTCCESCNAIYTDVAGCEYGDKTDCGSITRYNCYFNEEPCCGTCNQPGYRNPNNPGCEFGDRASSCQKDRCPIYSTDNLLNCCETCSDQTPPTTPTTTTTTTTTTSTTTATTTTPRTPTTTTATKTTTTPTSRTTTRPSTTPIPTQSTSIASSTSEPSSSDPLIIGVGAGAGVLVAIVVAVVVFLLLRRRRQKPKTPRNRQPSLDNAYDNIAFVRGVNKPYHLPHHPPPRREPSISSDKPPTLPSTAGKDAMRRQKIVPSAPHLTISTVDGITTHADGYMTPSEVSFSMERNGVQYSAPNVFKSPNPGATNTFDNVENGRLSSPAADDRNNRNPIHHVIQQRDADTGRRRSNDHNTPDAYHSITAAPTDNNNVTRKKNVPFVPPKPTPRNLQPDVKIQPRRVLPPVVNRQNISKQRSRDNSTSGDAPPEVPIKKSPGLARKDGISAEESSMAPNVPVKPILPMKPPKRPVPRRQRSEGRENKGFGSEDNVLHI